jgi:Xaa-Pro aminopeptidase
MNEEFQLKTARIRKLLHDKTLSGILLSRRSNFAWLTGGGQNHVGLATEFGVGSLFITENQVYLLANNIEIQRLKSEECSQLPVEVLSWAWEQESTARTQVIRQIVGEAPIGQDGPGSGPDLTHEVMEARHPLLPIEVERYRKIGQAAEQVLSETVQVLSVGITEKAVAACMSALCLEQDLEATVRLVAFDERIDSYRHPIPTTNRLGKTALLVLGARRHGLTVSLSRMISFGRTDRTLVEKHQAVCRVDTVLNLASRPGRTLGEILHKGIAQYGQEGYPEEWHYHHQGGLTGYEGRDIRATRDTAYTLVAPAAVAWNPTIRGTKSEDTFLITEAGVENLTYSNEWEQIRSETPEGVLNRCAIREM